MDNTDLIFDVGLHKGEDTDYYLKKNYRVVAFEASPALIEFCETRFSEFIADGRLVLVSGAIADAGSDGDVPFFINSMNSTWGTIDPAWVERNAQHGAPSTAIHVKRVDMADVFATYGVPYYLKVDIEGADRIVLNSLRALDVRPRYLSIETEKEDFARLREELDILRGLGYRRFKPVEQSVIPGTPIRTRNLAGDEFEYTFQYGASGLFGEDLPGPWLDYDQCLSAYRRIFRRYRMFGEDSPVNRIPKLARAAEILLGPAGWHDLHATV